MHSRLIDCFYSVFFAVVSLIAQHNHRHGLPTLILSLSVITQPNDALKLAVRLRCVSLFIYRAVYQIYVLAGCLSVCSELIDKGNHCV